MSVPDSQEHSRVRLTEAEQRDIRETRERILKKAARVRDWAHEQNMALMARIRAAHPETDKKVIKPEGEWLIIFEPNLKPVILGANGRVINGAS
jgi:hypothetical protein